MKVGIIVGQDFFTNHVGVRNYVLGLGSLLSQKVRVDYLAQQTHPSSDGQWYIMQPVSRRVAADNSVVQSVGLEGAPVEVFNQYHARAQQPIPATPTPPQLALGSKLEFEKYDVLIVSSPWCVQFAGRLPAKKVIGLAFDTIPNSISFKSWTVRPFAFASEHVRGYRYFRDHVDSIYTISRETTDSLTALFSIPSSQVVTLPPFLPIGYLGRSVPEVERGPNLILASPFDPRKGIALIPSRVNPSAEVLGKLLIYGTPRCPMEMVAQFFHELDARLKVIWYPAATTDVIMSMFAESRLLLFPSHQEGLGLPILEAQFCGARVAAFPISPMVENMLPGAISLSDSAANDAEQIRSALGEINFDHTGLARVAAAKFSFDAIRETLNRSIFH